MGILGTTEILVILGIALIAFGPSRLPELARYIAKAMRMFNEASQELKKQLDLNEWEMELDSKKKYSTSTTYADSTGEGSDGSGKDGSESDSADGYHYDEYGYVQDWEESSGGDSSDTAVKEDSIESRAEPQPVIDEPEKTDDAARYNREMQD